MTPRTLRHRVLLAAGFAMFAALLPQATFAQAPANYRIVLGYPPAGTLDILARIVATGLEQQLGKPVVVENLPGASGAIALNKVATSPPNGATLLMASINDVLADINDNTRKLETLAPLGPVATVQDVLVGRPSLEASTVEQLVKTASTSSAPLTLGAAGVGTVPHLEGVRLQQHAGFPITYAPYKGANQIVPDLIGGHLDLAVLVMPAALPHIKSGTIRAYGVFAPKRAAAAPDIPALGEANALKSMSLLPGLWTAVMVPAQTPPAVRKTLADALAATLASADVQRKLIDAGAEPMRGTADELAKMIQDDTRAYRQILSTTQLKAR